MRQPSAISRQRSAIGSQPSARAGAIENVGPNLVFSPARACAAGPSDGSPRRQPIDRLSSSLSLRAEGRAVSTVERPWEEGRGQRDAIRIRRPQPRHLVGRRAESGRVLRLRRHRQPHRLDRSGRPDGVFRLRRPEPPDGCGLSRRLIALFRLRRGLEPDQGAGRARLVLLRLRSPQPPDAGTCSRRRRDVSYV